MSKIIKYNDFIQINPDKKILTLDKQEKVILTDNILNSAYNRGKGLIVTYDLSHSGRKINNRIYSTKGQQRGIESLISPYPKPILKNHDQSSEPIGRFIGGEWEDLYEDAIGFFGAADQVLDVRNAFIRDEPGEIYSVMKKNGLIQNRRWPGLGRMRVQANITDEDAIRKFIDGRYITFSAGSTTDRHVCSICEADWAMDGMCEHRHGQDYDGETCVFITGDFIVLEGSVVNTPADDLSQVVSMEISDSLDIEQQDKKDIPYELIMSDSLIEQWRKEDGLQTTEQINAYQEKTNEKEESPKKEVSKKYDHEMSISDKAMMELHEKGETYITQRGDGETMIIKVKYSGSMRKDSLNFELLETELKEFSEELNDEKMFKVPSGAKGNAQKVLDWKKEKGSEVKGMTPVGWARARQLASKSEIGLSTVKRMAAFNRHRKNAAVAPEYKSEPWKDRGYVAWLGWGGTSGIDWAVKISAANNDNLYNEVTKDEKELFTTPLSEIIGDFDLDEKKSLTKITKQKDFNMEEKETTKEVDLILETEDSEKDLEAEIKTTEEGEEKEGEESFDEDETLDAEDSEQIDWEFLDLAMQGSLMQEDAQLSREERKELSESVFCGPDRLFPISDYSHVSIAKNLVERTKYSDATKIKIIAFIDEKAELLSFSSDNSNNSLKKEFEELKDKYNDLENKFKEMLESLVVKSKKLANTIEKDSNSIVIENNVELNDNKVESPSEHLKEDSLVENKKELKLPPFEQKIVDTFKEIKDSEGEYAAMVYLDSKIQYLPRGFNPSKF